MSNSIFTAKVIAFKRRAAKVDASPGIVKQFLELAGTHYVHVTNGNSKNWSKFGSVGSFTDNPVVDGKETYVTYSLCVKTVWEGGDYTTVTKIEKSTTGGDWATTLVAKDEVLHKREVAHV